MSAPSKTVALLDLGGVLVGVEHGGAIRALAELAGEDVETVQQVVHGSGLKRAADLGEINAAAFRLGVREGLDLDISDADLDAAWNRVLVPLPRTGELVRRLSERARVFALSNVDPIHMEKVRDDNSEWLQLFDGVFLSYEVKLEKPDPRFFLTALETYALSAEDCLFLDDIQENVDGARAAGIDAELVGPGGLGPEHLALFGISSEEGYPHG